MILLQDSLLTAVVRKFNAKNWKQIDVQCLHRWQKVVNPELIKEPWSKEEDDSIIELVQKHGCSRWSIILQRRKSLLIVDAMPKTP
ncbi:transcription factor MYB3R-5-like [Silene latifolia]|uniref:transcription factor MYB3R-5-like n=1 Tax=Silene latifolia TaxID=37657 RepID=UPI003D7815B7